MKKLYGKTAYITGGGQGIGREICLKLAADGANIVVNDLAEDKASAVVKELEDLGVKAIAVIGSVTEAGFGERFIQSGLKTFGSVDIIVNNAGYTWDGFAHKMSDEQFDAMLDVHLKAPFNILRAASGFIREQAKIEAEEGREFFRKVVNISSVVGLSGNAGQVNYSSAKAGVVGLTKTLAKEWGRLKVNVNCVAFGFIETRLTASTDEKKTVVIDGNEISLGIPGEMVKGITSSIPLGRAGTAQEAADGVYLMCLPESNYITGQTLVVSGGISA